jgi:Tetrahydrofolate dehydrogenase/cyclohydrolase, catalytic domain
MATDREPEPSLAPKGVLLKADIISEPFLTEVKVTLAALSRSRPPKLVGILATTNVPSRSYAEFTRKQCAVLGIEFELREVGSALNKASEYCADGDGVEEAIIEANADDTVDGIMVRLYARILKLYVITWRVSPGLLSDFRQGAGTLAKMLRSRAKPQAAEQYHA